MSSTEWNLRNDTVTSPTYGKRSRPNGINHSLARQEKESSDEDDYENDEEHTLSPQASAWRQARPRRHHPHPSASSAESGAHGRNMFELDEDASSDPQNAKDSPARHALLAAPLGQQRKPAQLRTLLLGNPQPA